MRVKSTSSDRYWSIGIHIRGIGPFLKGVDMETSFRVYVFLPETPMLNTLSTLIKQTVPNYLCV